jgi:hypothetical protein
LKTLLRKYTRYVIDEAWPLQRQGIVPPGAVKQVGEFQESLIRFEPQTKAQEALHAVAMRQFGDFFEQRRIRLYSVNSSIPGLLWYTVAVGALINMIFIWLFDLRLGTHLLLGGMISFFLATSDVVTVRLDIVRACWGSHQFDECPFMAQSGPTPSLPRCPVLGVKPTLPIMAQLMPL